MTKIIRITLLAAAALLSSAFAHAQAPAWPASNAADRAYFCGTSSAGEADNTPPAGYGQRLAEAMGARAGKDSKAAIVEMATIAGCPRIVWTEQAAAAAQASLHWPAGNAVDVAWLCSPSHDGVPPKDYDARLVQAVYARADAGMGLEELRTDIRRVAGCPAGLPGGSVANN